MSSKVEHHAEQLSALGHPVRLAILRFVVQAGREGATAGDILGHVELAASTLSHHLKRLVDAGLNPRVSPNDSDVGVMKAEASTCAPMASGGQSKASLSRCAPTRRHGD